MNINVFNLPGKRKHFGDNIPRAPSDRLSMQDYRQDKNIPIWESNGDPVNNHFPI